MGSRHRLKAHMMNSYRMGLWGAIGIDDTVNVDAILHRSGLNPDFVREYLERGRKEEEEEAASATTTDEVFADASQSIEEVEALNIV